MQEDDDTFSCSCCLCRFLKINDFISHECCKQPNCSMMETFWSPATEVEPVLRRCSECGKDYADLCDYLVHECCTQISFPQSPQPSTSHQIICAPTQNSFPQSPQPSTSHQIICAPTQNSLPLSPQPSTSHQNICAHQNNSSQHINLKCGPNKRKKFYCDRCKKGLSTQERLSKHMKVCGLSLLTPTQASYSTLNNFTLLNQAFNKNYRLYSQNIINCFTLEDVVINYGDDNKNLVEAVVMELGPIKIAFSLSVVFEKLVSGESVESHMHSIFKKYYHESEPITDLIRESFTEIQNIIDHYTERGSGFRILSVNNLDVYVAKYQPHHGGCSWIKLPPALTAKRCISSMQCNQDCFMYSVLAGLYNNGANINRVNLYEQYIDKHDFSMWRGDVTIDQIAGFEKRNNISVSVFSYHFIKKYVIPVRIAKNQLEKHVKLFLFQDHYSLITSFSRLLNSRTNYRRFHCERCLYGYRLEIQLENHIIECKKRAVQAVFMPKAKNGSAKVPFVQRQLNKEIRHPFVIYADFECIAVPTSDSIKITRHEPTSYGYCIMDWNKKIIKSEFLHGENIAKEFLLSIKNSEKWMRNYLKEHQVRELHMLPEDEQHFENAIYCWICREALCDDRVRDHDHLTGRYRGAAHNNCNLNYSIPKRIPIFFHNLKNYDSHILIKGMDAKIFTDITIIPQTMEKYIGWFFGNFAFLDSFAFLPASLDTLAKDLSIDEKNQMLRQLWRDEDLTDLYEKATLPYEYLDSYEKYADSTLPPIEKFYSSLNDSNCSIEMYSRLERIWKQFNCESLGQLIDIYLKLDVLMLAAIFENFRETSITDFGIDPPHYMSVPGLSLASAVKMLRIGLELFTELDMYIMIENGKRGGFTTTVKRYAKANNPNQSSYNGGDQTWLLYLDVNNLYGHAMLQTLPVGDYRWVRNFDLHDILSTPSSYMKGYILEVDLEYPNHLHDDHNDFPLAPHKMLIEHSMLSPTAMEILDGMNYKPALCEKLVATFLPRKKYVVHYQTLKFYVFHGMVVTKVHRVISFKQKKWLAPFIEFCTEKRQNAASPFISSLYKLFVNSNYGKMLEDKRQRCRVDLVLNEAMAARRIRNSQCKSMKILDEEKVLFQMIPDAVLLDKPIIVGFTILELAKLHVYTLYYDKLKSYFHEKMSLVYSDTDSLLIELKTNTFVDDMEKFDDIMDFSDLPPSDPLFSLVNKKRIGCLKDEMAGDTIEEVIAIRPKLYAVKTKNGVKKKAKGVQQAVVKNKLTFEDYHNSLFNNAVVVSDVNRLGSDEHNIHQYKQKKLLCLHLKIKDT